MTPLAEAAVRLHEMYVELCHAGFSEEQALVLVTAVLTSYQRPAAE